MTIPAGEAFVPFFVLAVDDFYVETMRGYTLTVGAPGYQGSLGTVNVLDNDAPVLGVSLDHTRVSEDAGPNAATLTIMRGADSVQPLTVQILRSNPAELTCAGSVTFNPGELIKTVPLSPVDDTRIDGNQTVTLTVEPLETLSLNPIPTDVSTNIIVLDDDGPTLRLALSRDWVCSINATNPAVSFVTATLERTGTTNSGVSVSLAADVPGLLDFPASVMFLSGETSQSFTVTATATAPTPPGQTIELTATAPSYADAVATLRRVTDCAPDLVISNLTVPANGLTDDYFSLSYREVNVGTAFAIVNTPPGITNIAQKVYLSTDPYPGDDTFLGAVLFDGAVNPYSFLDRSATFRLPSVPGDYWVIVEADGSNSVAEVSEANNFAVSAAPIHVDPAYTATVSANVESALAGTPVNLSGTAHQFGTALPAPFEIVSLSIGLRGTTRVIAALTDANGNYSATFTPLPGEAGTYTVGAAHPGVTNVPGQDTFTLLGLRATPSTLSLTVPALTTVTQTVVLANLGDVALTSLTPSVIGLPSEFTAAANVSASLAPFGNGTLSLVIGAVADTNVTRSFTVRVTSAEGAVGDVIVTATSQSLRPRLEAAPASLLAGVVPGSQRFVEFSVVNNGGATSGPLNILAPSLPFLRVLSPATLPALAPGASNSVSLQLAPALGTTLGDYTGSIVLSDGAASVSVPFSFRVLSTNTGSLVVEVTDQFTYYSEGSPRVTNALVELQDPATGALITNGVSDANGLAVFPNLTEGYYALAVTAPDHSPYRKTILVPAGDTAYQEALLNREVVQFFWSVTPTDIGDRTHITIEAVFETVVPVPVVTVEPSVIDLANFPNGGTINLTITNHGLLAAQDVHIGFTGFDCWQITPLISDVGTLAARSAMVVPVTICHDLTCSRDFSSCANAGTPHVAADETQVRRILAEVKGTPKAGGGANCGVVR